MATATKTATRSTTTKPKKTTAAAAPAGVSSDASTEGAVVEEIAVVSGPMLRKKELIELAVERSGVKKRDAKPAIEAALAVLGEAMAEGRSLNLVPMGKLKVNRMKKSGNATVISARIRRPDQTEKTDVSPLDPSDD